MKSEETNLITIFDLDGTTIDSSHRHVARADGSFCLSGWRKNSTPEKVARDRLLPLGIMWRNMKPRKDRMIIICTARVMGEADYKFLRDNNLRYDLCLSRNGDHDKRSDAQLKVDNLSRYGIDWASVSHIFWEDNASVREAVSALNIYAQDPGVI
jgi:hypothetical protein